MRQLAAALAVGLAPLVAGCAGMDPSTTTGRGTITSTSLAARQAPDNPQRSPAPVTVALHALLDTVVAHQTAWVEVRITNNGQGGLDVPDRDGHLVAEWRFEDGDGRLKHDWPNPGEIVKAPIIRVGPGETLYEVIALESSFGILTEPGTTRVFCRVKDATSPPIPVNRVAERSGTPPSVLRDAGPLLGAHARDNIQVKLWTACAGNGHEWFDCDEALYTVAWDRMQSAPIEAQAVVDTLISRHPDSGWCRPAIHDLLKRLPDAAGRRWIDAVIERKPGGVAERYAREMVRRAGYGQFPAVR